MTRNQKLVTWVSIIGAGVVASLTTAIKFFPDLTALLTAGGGLIGAIIAFIVTRKQEA